MGTVVARCHILSTDIACGELARCLPWSGVDLRQTCSEGSRKRSSSDPRLGAMDLRGGVQAQRGGADTEHGKGG